MNSTLNPSEVNAIEEPELLPLLRQRFEGRKILGHQPVRVGVAIVHNGAPWWWTVHLSEHSTCSVGHDRPDSLDAYVCLSNADADALLERGALANGGHVEFGGDFEVLRRFFQLFTTDSVNAVSWDAF